MGVPLGVPVEVTIEAVGSGGDGIAHIAGHRLFVPLAAPGDRVRAVIEGRRGDGCKARLLDVLTASDARATPPCPYFGECGGCALQHLSQAIYRDWKRNQVIAELAHRGLPEVCVAPLAAIPAPSHGDDADHGRRRALFAASKQKGDVRIGFNARGSHLVIGIDRCLLLTPALNRTLEPLRDLFADLLREGERGQAVVTDLDGHADILLATPKPPELADRECVAAFAARHNIARVSWRTNKEGRVEPITQRRPCQIVFGKVAVDFPPGGFLQPSAAGETALRRLVLEGIGDAARVADLFAGLGTFTFALAARPGLPRGARVHAVEMDPALTNALSDAAARAGLAGRVTGEVRDLERRPLAADELASFDAVVFDPPRPGARRQAQALAVARNLTRAVAVSCNPATFARDAHALVDGGFVLERVVPVDQFVFSPHVEVVGLFRRPLSR